MQNQRNEFNEYIKEYRKNQSDGLWLSGETSEFFAEYKVQKLASWFPEYAHAPIKILDFGCGDGVMTHYTKTYFPSAHVYGIDPSEKSIACAKSIYEKDNITFDVMDKETLLYPDQSFDLVFAAGVFHHIPFNEHSHFIKELARITKKGGRIIIFELNPINPLTMYTFKMSPIEKNAQMLRPWYAKKLITSLGKTETKYYAFFPAFAKKLRPLEPYMTWFPIGALYATIVKLGEK